MNLQLQGHDDAMAILLAVHCQNITLLGVSTVILIGNREVTVFNPSEDRFTAMQVQTTRILMQPDVFMQWVHLRTYECFQVPLSH